MRLRPHRVQKVECRAAVAAELGEAAADEILAETGIAALPDRLPAGPRDLPALAAELQPFVDLYRALLRRTDRETALRIVHRAIIQSGMSTHAADQAAQAEALAAAGSAPAPASAGPEPLNLTSPPPPGFQATPAELDEGFRLAMAYFSCEGELLEYRPEQVRFRVTRCNWCTAMEQAGAPELTPFFCETDDRFMDHHPTHRLDKPTAIGLGDDHCEFRFVPRKPE